MPPYTTISVSVDKSADKHIVKNFCDVFLSEDVRFKGVLAWGCDANLGLDEIIAWNQNKLDENFVLGFDQHVSHNYRQICLDVEPFRECRLITSYSNDELVFHCIVPEDEISLNNAGPLAQAFLRVWDSLPTYVVESYGELGCGKGYRDVKLGVEPSTQIFSIVDEGHESKIDLSYYNHRKLKRGHFLQLRGDLEEPILISEVKKVSKVVNRIIEKTNAASGGKPNFRRAPGANRFTELPSKVIEYIAAEKAHLAVEFITNAIEQTGVLLPEREYRKMIHISRAYGCEFPVRY